MTCLLIKTKHQSILTSYRSKKRSDAMTHTPCTPPPHPIESYEHGHQIYYWIKCVHDEQPVFLKKLLLNLTFLLLRI